MKDIPVEELTAISPEIQEAAVRVGCTEVSITGQIWPGGRLNGPAEEAARFVEFSWLRAAVINRRAIFEEADPQKFAALLNTYGLGNEPYAEPASETPVPEDAQIAPDPAPSTRITLNADVLPATMSELDRQARAAGLSVGEFLDWKFQMRVDR